MEIIDTTYHPVAEGNRAPKARLQSLPHTHKTRGTGKGEQGQTASTQATRGNPKWDEGETETPANNSGKGPTSHPQGQSLVSSQGMKWPQPNTTAAGH